MTNAVAIAQSGSNNVTMRNKIINGAMMIDQRNAGASVTPTNGSYTLDRWQCQASQASKFTVQQNAGSVTPPVGFSNYLGVTSTSAYSIGAADYFAIDQSIEGFNFADCQFGTANAKTITISAWVYSSLTGTFGGAVLNNAYSRAYPFTYSIPVANTWTQISVTIAGDTTGTWVGATNSIGIQVSFGLGVGANQSATAGSWTAAGKYSATGAVSVVGTNGATFYITGVQLEAGTAASPFENRLYGTELALCQRYFYNHVSGTGRYFSLSNYYTSGYLFGFVNFPVTMRTGPSLVASSGTNYYNNICSGAADGFNSLGIDSPTTSCSAIYNSTEVSGTAGQAGIIATNNASASVSFSAEL
jgi:hypothetical protein